MGASLAPGLLRGQREEGGVDNVGGGLPKRGLGTSLCNIEKQGKNAFNVTLPVGG